MLKEGKLNRGWTLINANRIFKRRSRTEQRGTGRLGVGLGLRGIVLLVLLGGSVAWGDSIKSVEGKVFRGEAALEAGAISITATNGEVTTLSLSNIDAVVFSDGDEVIPGEQNL